MAFYMTIFFKNLVNDLIYATSRMTFIFTSDEKSTLRLASHLNIYLC